MTPVLILWLTGGCVRSEKADSAVDADSVAAAESARDSAPPTDSTVTCTPGPDEDGDGHPTWDATCAVVDCDDADAAVYPHAPDTAGDGLDADCDGDDDCGWGPPLEGSLFVETEQDMVDFCAEHASMTGVVEVASGAEVTDLSALGCLCAFRGLVIKENAVITSLVGLEGVRGHVEDIVVWAPEYFSTAGLEGITSADEVDIYVQAGLDLSGLRSLTTVGGLYLDVGDDLAEADLSPLGNLEVATVLGISNSDSLRSLRGLDSLTTVEHTLYFSDNESLTTLEGLDALRVVSVKLALNLLDVFESLEGLPTLDELGAISFMHLPALASLAGLEFLASTHFIYLEDLGALPDLAGLDNLVELAGTEESGLYLINLGIVTVHGLEALRLVEGDVTISDNANLVDLSAMHGIESIDGALVIRDNAVLPTDEAWALVDAIGEENIRGGVVIEGNGG